VQRLAFQLAEAAPLLIAFGPIAGLACILTAWLAGLRTAPAAA
jgi:hypothetical protein